MKTPLRLLIALFATLLSAITLVTAQEATTENTPKPAPATETPPAVPAKPTPGLLSFVDQTQIQGFPLTHKKGQPLQWSSALFLKPVSFSIDKLVSLALPKTTAHPALEDNPDLIEITIKRSEDTFIGALESFDDQTVTLSTSYAGTLNIRRDMIQKFRVLDQAKSLLGPTSSLLDDSWVISPEDAWVRQDNKLLSQRAGSFGTEIKTPRYSQYSFDLEWREFPRITMHFLADEKFENYYEFSLQSLYNISFRKHGPNLRHRNHFQRVDHNKLRFLNSQEHARLDIYLDRKKRTFTLYIENKLILEYTDPDLPGAPPAPDQQPEEQQAKNDKDNLATHGHHFRFFNSKSSPLKIARFEVLAWNGRLPKPSRSKMNLPPGFKLEGTSISLRNGDRIFGELLGIKNKIATIKTSRGNVQLPLIFIKDLPITSNQQPNEPILRPHDVRAQFHNGGHLTFELDELTPQKITGSSQTFGTATFDLSAFHRLDFNIHEEEIKAHASKSKW